MAHNAVAIITNYISLKALALSLAFVAVLYTVFFAFLWLSSGLTIKNLEQKLASKTFPVKVKEFEPEPAVQQQTPDREDTPSRFARNTNSLVPAPLPGLYETTNDGLLIPQKAINGLTPFKAYRKPFDYVEGPAIGIAITDFGLSRVNSEQALRELPHEISYILSPYANDILSWSREARRNGNEIWLEIPVDNEKLPYRDPGAKSLLVDKSLRYNQERLFWLLGRTTGYAGVVAYTDRTIENAKGVFNTIFSELFSRGLGYLELNSQSKYVTALAQNQDAPFDSVTTELGTLSLKRLEEQARDKGHIIVKVRPTPQNISALKTWLPTLASKNITLAPVSALAARKPANNYSSEDGSEEKPATTKTPRIEN